MLNLDRRSATIGSSLSASTQKHGDEKVPALYLQLDSVVISENEFNSLLGDPKAEQCFFDPPGRTSSMATPRFPKLDALKLKDKIEGVRVSLWLDGKDTAIVLNGCNLAKVTLEPQDGGTTLLSFQVQCAEPGDKQVSKIFDHMGATVSVEIVELQEDLADKAA